MKMFTAITFIVALAASPVLAQGGPKDGNPAGGNAEKNSSAGGGTKGSGSGGSGQ